MPLDSSFPTVDLHASGSPRATSASPAFSWRELSFARVLVAGLAGSLVNALAIQAVLRTGVPTGTGGLAKMTLAATNSGLEALGFALRVPANFDPIGQEVFHAATGLAMAFLYARLFYLRLAGPGWLRGLVFCQIPWLIQAFVVLPWINAGVLGFHLSPWTPLTAFLLNAVFGLTIGAIYHPRRRLSA